MLRLCVLGQPLADVMDGAAVILADLISPD